MPFIDDITCPIYDMSSTVYDITFIICVTSHNACISDVTHSMFLTYPPYMASHTVLWQHKHCVTSQPLCLTSLPLDLCHHTKCMYDITDTICMTSYEFYVTSQQLFMTSQDCIHDITSTLFMTSPPLNMTSHTLYLWPQATVTMTRHILYFWCYSQCIWHLTWWMNDNTATVSDMIPNVSV